MFSDFAYWDSLIPKKFEAVTKIYIKDTIYVKCKVTNYVWLNLMDSIRLFRIPFLPSLKLGIRYFKAKSRRDSGLKVCARAGDGMPKINLGITGSVGL